MHKLEERIETLARGGINLHPTLTVSQLRSEIAGFAEYGVMPYATLVGQMAERFSDDLLAVDLESDGDYTRVIEGLARLSGQEERLTHLVQAEQSEGGKVTVSFQLDGAPLRYRLILEEDDDWLDLESLGDVAATPKFANRQRSPKEA